MPPAAETRPLVLLVEDEAPMRTFLRTYLSSAGYRLNEAASGQEALELAVEKPPDLVILDLGLPDMDGQDVLQLLREWLRAPIIVVSVRNQDAQKVTALDNGADDYPTKPFNTGELMARVRVAFRHAMQGSNGNGSSVFESGGLLVDFAARQVFVQDREVHLTPMEYKLLCTLVQHAGRVLTHQYLLREV